MLTRSASAHRDRVYSQVGNQAAQRLLQDGVIQAKLTVNQPGDRFEQEADWVADAVMRMPEPGSAESFKNSNTNLIPVVQRMCPKCQKEIHPSPDGIQRQCSECRTASNTDPEEEFNIRAKETPGGTPEINPTAQAQIESIRGGGQPLPEVARTFFEPRFGRNFSDIRIHTDARAAESAKKIQSLAYTRGRDIVFGAGQFSPNTFGGRRLLAHELTHVVQQGGGDRANGQNATASSIQRIGDPSQAPPGMSCPIATTSSADPVVTNVLFPISASSLSAAAVTDIDSFVGRWNAAGTNPVVRVDGFASTDGPQPTNWTLSCNRASAVARELETPSSGAPGIPNQFIDVFAQGETSEFGATLAPNRRATISANLAVPPPPPACAHPGDSRTLDLQPVFLRTDATDTAPTGVSWTRRFNEANAIWGKLGITFTELTPLTIDTPLKTNGNSIAERDAVAALRAGPGVEVFMVDNDMLHAGGGSTRPPGAPLCDGNIVMSDRGTSDTLLAHELGHMLGIGHPGTGANSGDPGTIMQGSGSHSVANPTRNTMVNFAAIQCPAPIASTCLNPDP